MAPVFGSVLVLVELLVSVVVSLPLLHPARTMPRAARTAKLAKIFFFISNSIHHGPARVVVMDRVSYA